MVVSFIGGVLVVVIGVAGVVVVHHAVVFVEGVRVVVIGVAGVVVVHQAVVFGEGVLVVVAGVIVVVIGAGVVVVGTAGHAPKEEQISSGGVFTKSSMIWGNSTCTKILQANGPPGNRSPSASQISSNAAMMSAIVASSSNMWSISVMMYLQMSHSGPWTF